MPTSKSHSLLGLSFAFLCTLLLSAWLNQSSLNRYLQQSYREADPLRTLESQSWWSIGHQVRQLLWSDDEQSALPAEEPIAEHHSHDATLKPVEQVTQFTPEPPQPESHLESEEQALKYEIDVLMYEFVQRELSQIAYYDHNLQRPPVLKLSTSSYDAPVVALKTTTPETKPAAENPTKPESALSETTPATKTPAFSGLQKGDRVVFMGDSMMQSLAPPLQRWLNQEHGISSTNLARHSTGLTNRTYYDWPHEIEQWLAQHHDSKVKMLVVQMGANDPWDIQEGKHHFRFQTDKWEAEYGGRIQRIINAAHARNMRVVWLGLPAMRSGKYDRKISYLNDFVLKTVSKSGATAFAVRPLISPKDSYQDSIIVNGKSVRVRSKDGIHLSREGDAYLAEQLQNTLVNP